MIFQEGKCCAHFGIRSPALRAPHTGTQNLHGFRHQRVVFSLWRPFLVFANICDQPTQPLWDKHVVTALAYARLAMARKVRLWPSKRQYNVRIRQHIELTYRPRCVPHGPHSVAATGMTVLCPPICSSTTRSSPPRHRRADLTGSEHSTTITEQFSSSCAGQLRTQRPDPFVSKNR